MHILLTIYLLFTFHIYPYSDLTTPRLLNNSISDLYHSPSCELSTCLPYFNNNKKYKQGIVIKSIWLIHSIPLAQIVSNSSHHEIIISQIWSRIPLAKWVTSRGTRHPWQPGTTQYGQVIVMRTTGDIYARTCVPNNQWETPVHYVSNIE